uniref:Integrase catalytic domain-containing protein n=1 Tax=Panagrellus redivivus TaxID=6233 RepID=A0A7E4VSC9_PANRE
CQKCFVFRSHKRERPPLIPFEESEPFQTVGIDLMDMPLSINGYKYVLVIVDHFSKFAMAVALRYKTAEQAADGLMTSFLKECQFPERIISDLGREFDNEVMRCLAEWIGVELRFTMGYNSKFNGAAERVIQTLRRTIAKKMGPQDEWDKMLPYAVYAYNTVPHEATNETPVFLTRGRQPLVPSAIDCEREISPMITIDDYKTELTTRIAATAKEVRERLEEYRQAM